MNRRGPEALVDEAHDSLAAALDPEHWAGKHAVVADKICILQVRKESLLERGDFDLVEVYWSARGRIGVGRKRRFNARDWKRELERLLVGRAPPRLLRLSRGEPALQNHCHKHKVQNHGGGHHVARIVGLTTLWFSEGTNRGDRGGGEMYTSGGGGGAERARGCVYCVVSFSVCCVCVLSSAARSL